MCFYFARQSFEESFFFQFAFPDHDQIPAELLQLFSRISIPLDIPLEFLLPEFRIRGWRRRLSASRMPMPETAAHLDYCLVLRQDNIGMARQIFDMKTETEAMPEEKRANHEFRFRILTVNPPHIPTTLFPCQMIHNIRRFIKFKSNSCTLVLHFEQS